MKKRMDKPPPADALDILQGIAGRIVKLDKGLTMAQRRASYEKYIEHFSELENFAWDCGYRLSIPALTGRKLEDIQKIFIFCKALVSVLENEKPLRKYGLLDDVSELEAAREELLPKMELNDWLKIQIHINEMNLLLEKTVYFSESHLSRIKTGVVKLQYALNKSTSFWDIFDNF